MKYSEKRRLFFLFALIMIGTIFYMIHVLNSLVNDTNSMDQKKIIKDSLNAKIENLERRAAENDLMLRRLEKKFKILLSKERAKSHIKMSGSGSNKSIEIEREVGLESGGGGVYYESQCEWFDQMKSSGGANIEMSKLIDELSFDDVDGGVWKQGFDISYDESEWSDADKLHVIVVPHSHNDPGWILTFEEYFEQRTRNILNTVLEALSADPSRKFVWAETSYLALWWQQASEEARARMRRLIVDTRQLEIVTGGWVMTDEANAHYYAMIEQMVEGHSWLRANVHESVRPVHGWSIDPFGYTPTMAYLLKQMGFEAMLIQRVHYHLKKHFANRNQLEFMWKQAWSTAESKDTSILCHAMPFYSYDIPHTCGPDPKVCCQFDFKRLYGVYACPWGLQPVQTSRDNVEERASLLLDQYRKKSQLYGGEHNHNIVLVPLGDDFRWQDMGEANDQYNNYKMLMDYMNSRKDWHVHAQFGTLSDYFGLLSKQSEAKGRTWPSLTGDFFTYADRQDHYWSGYFTSRVFYKRLDRLVEYYVRAAEIAFSLGNLAEMERENKFERANLLYKELIAARRHLGLFQHHDGITGTSKTHVVLDYADKLYAALRNSKNVIESSLSYVLSTNKPIKSAQRGYQQNSSSNLFDIDDIRLVPEKFAPKSRKFLNLKNQQQQSVLLFNSLLNKRNEIVSFRVNSANVEVIVEEERGGGSYQLGRDKIQISLIWPNTADEPLDWFANRPNHQQDIDIGFDEFHYELLFEVDIEPMSTRTYTIKSSTDSSVKSNSQVDFYLPQDSAASLDRLLPDKSKWEKISKLSANRLSQDEKAVFEIKLNAAYTAKFSARSGFLQGFHSATTSSSSPASIKSSIRLVKYGTTQSSSEKSGAYLFLPDGPAVDIDPTLLRWIRVEQGNTLRDRVCANYTIVLHCVEFYHSRLVSNTLKLPLFNVWNVVDLRKAYNYELAMHIETDIQNDNVLYTDLNGFQYVRRRGYLSKLHIQGNVYPMPTGAFIQDARMRMNILTTQPVGVASLDSSSIQVFLDRRLDQDDNRGMEQPMNDNVVVASRFLVLFEPVVGGSGQNEKLAHELNRMAFPSIVAQVLSNNLLNPLIKLFLRGPVKSINSLTSFAEDSTLPPCDLYLVNMRTMQANREEEPTKRQVSLILHRLANDHDCPSGHKSVPYVDTTQFVADSCASTGYFSFELFFKQILPQNKPLKVFNTLLTLAPSSKTETSSIRPREPILKYIQPVQIEAFSVEF